MIFYLETDDGYALRQLGNVLGLAVILGSIVGGSALLLRQDQQLLRWRTFTDLGEFFFTKYAIAPKIFSMFLHYARPGYHPDDDDYSGLAKSVLNPT